MRRRPPQQKQKRKPNPFAAHPGLPTTSVNLLTSNKPTPLNPFLASLQDPSPPPFSGATVDLSFKAGQAVGIHFRWANGFYVVVGFTDDSPAKAQGKVENGCTLLAVNGVALSGVQQKVSRRYPHSRAKLTSVCSVICCFLQKHPAISSLLSS